MISRRRLLASGLAAAVVPATAGFASDAGQLSQALAALENQHGGRLGVCALDTATGRQAKYRADELFAMCSTSKFLSAACVLRRVDRGEERLDRRVVYAKESLVTYSPETQKHAGGEGMTIAELCAAALTLSDNTAANLLLGSFGGPAALTAFARAIGDPVTRLDREETALNEATPGDPRDTTTPAAMAETMRKLLLGDALSAASREQLASWLIANTTGDKRIRAGLPAGWRVGDKTGSGEHGATNDIAVAWPPGRAPIIVAAYYAESSAPMDAREQVLAEVGRLAAAL